MGKDLPKPHGWLTTELDFHPCVLAPCLVVPSLSTYLPPSRYHLANQRFELKETAKCLLTTEQRVTRAWTQCWAGRTLGLAHLLPGLAQGAWEWPLQPFLWRAEFTECFPPNRESGAP